MISDVYIFLSDYVLNPPGIVGLLSLLFIVIAYLIRPRIKVYKLPSVIFLMQQRFKRKRYRWLKYVPTNWMLLWHLLIAVLLVIALLNPFIWSDIANRSDHVIHIIDISASMQAGNRMQDAKQLAIQNMGRLNTIITAHSSSNIVLEQASGVHARPIIQSLQPLDTPTDIPSAIRLALTTAQGDSVIHIYSDFGMNRWSDDIRIAIDIAQAQGNLVYLHQVTGGTNELGFVDSRITHTNIIADVRNFANHDIETVISDGYSSKSLIIPAQQTTSVSFTIPQTDVTLRIMHQDGFMLDNTLYVAGNQIQQQPILYVSNRPNEHLITALSLIDTVSVRYYEPPGVIDVENFQLFILEQVDHSRLLPGVVIRMLDQVHQGGLLIVKMSESMRDFSIDGMPIKEIQPTKQGSVLLEQHPITDSLTAYSPEYVWTGVLQQGSQVIATTQQGEPIIALRGHGQGYIVYYGINDMHPQASFKLSYAYPILFKRLIDHALDIPSVLQSNMRTGSLLTISSHMTSPHGERIEFPNTLSHAGFYRGQHTIAANLLDQDESAIHRHQDISLLQSGIRQQHATGKHQQSIQWIFAIIAMLMLIIELIVLKWRGEL